MCVRVCVKPIPYITNFRDFWFSHKSNLHTTIYIQNSTLHSSHMINLQKKKKIFIYICRGLSSAF